MLTHDRTSEGAARSMAVRVVGLGSPFGLDRIGWRVAARVRAEVARRNWTDRADVVAEARVTDLPLLVDATPYLIVIDAMRSDAAMGTVRCLRAQELTRERSSSSHGLGVMDALEVARALGGSPAEFVIYGIEIGAPGISDIPDSETARIVSEAAQQIVQHIERLLANN